MTKKTKEAIKASAAIVIAVLAILLLWIYPLNQAGKIISRPDTEPVMSDPDKFGLAYDTLSFNTEDNIHLSGQMLKPAPAESDPEIPADSFRGTFVLVHGLFGGAATQMEKAAVLAEAGYKVIVYDQRAYGQSEGEYRSGGFFEGNDLQGVLYRLNLEDRLVHPLVVWGEEHGASAALHAWEIDERIDYVVAENPIVDGRDWQKRIRDHDERSAPDLMLGLIWWWMKQTSGYEFSVEDVDISDDFGSAIVNRNDKLLTIACGQGDTPDNEYLAELKAMGGHWLVLPCDEETTIFERHREKIIPAVMNLIETSP